jgi:hypothetical protein
VAFGIGYLAARGASPSSAAPSTRLGSLGVETAGVKVSALDDAPTPPKLGRGERKHRTSGAGNGGGGGGTTNPQVITTATVTPRTVTPPPPKSTPRPTPTGIPGD